MHIAGKRNKIIGEINITPLTDIFLVLLIIMMLVAPLLNTKGLHLAVPSMGPSPDTKEQPKVTHVKIDAQGAYLVENEPVAKASLEFQIKKHAGTHPDGVLIEANPDSSHEALTGAMDAVQAAGITKLAVTAAQGEGSAPAESGGEQ